MDSTIARRNARLVIATSFFGDLAFILPIWLLYSINSLHFSPNLAIIIFTGIWVISSIFEIPTGALADRWGRKKTFMMGNALLVLFPLAYVLHAPLWVFFVTMIIGGLGHALGSGSLAPLVYESFEEAKGSKKTYHLFLSQSTTALFIARAISGITGAWLYTVAPTLPFAFWALAIIVNIVICFFIIEPPREKFTDRYHAHISTALGAIRHSKLILSMLAAYIIIDLNAEAIWTGYQLFYTQDDRSPFVIGILFSCIAVLSALGAYFVRKLYVRFHPLTILFGGALFVSFTALLLAQSNPTVRLLAIIPMAITSGCTAVIMAAVIQHIIPNKLQSTALSVNSIIVYIVYCVGSFWVGQVISSYGLNAVRQTLLITSLISLSIITVFTLYATRRNHFRLEEKDIASVN